jgi:hypothetical protein
MGLEGIRPVKFRVILGLRGYGVIFGVILGLFFFPVSGSSNEIIL